MGEFYEGGLCFSCVRCSSCCRHSSGYVFLSKADIAQMCAHTKMREEEFLSKYCRMVDYGSEVRVSLIEKDNMDCIFWSMQRNGCQIYPARPLQCQSYPFWAMNLSEQAWGNEGKNCPGINQGRRYSKEEIEAILALRKENPLINLKEK